jgi:hypothetical protein
MRRIRRKSRSHAPLISNTDQGSQFTSTKFIDAVESDPFTPSLRHYTFLTSFLAPKPPPADTARQLSEMN